jgi:hypothetical protein
MVDLQEHLSTTTNRPGLWLQGAGAKNDTAASGRRFSGQIFSTAAPGEKTIPVNLRLT